MQGMIRKRINYPVVVMFGSYEKGRSSGRRNEVAGMNEHKGEICDNCERKSQVFAITRICGYPSLQTKLRADCMKCGYSVTRPREILHTIHCGLNSEEIVGAVNNPLIRINQNSTARV
jgi:hypothetical protein